MPSYTIQVGDELVNLKDLTDEELRDLYGELSDDDYIRYGQVRYGRSRVIAVMAERFLHGD